MGLLTEPLLLKFYLGGEEQSFGLPPTIKSLEAYLEMIKGVRCNWFAATLGGDNLPLVPAIVSLGGHVRVGLEDYQYTRDGKLSNPQIAERAAATIRAMGHRSGNHRTIARAAGNLTAQPSKGFFRTLALHNHAQDAIDAGLIPLTLCAEPFEDISVEPNRQLLLGGGPGSGGAREEGLVQWRNVRTVDFGFAYTINARQVAFDRSFFHVDATQA